MKTLKLQWFTNQDALRPVGRYLLAAFFNRFHDDLTDFGIGAPNPISQTPHYFFQAATMLKMRTEWPVPFEQALLEVEEMAEAAARTEPRASASGTATLATEQGIAGAATDAPVQSSLAGRGRETLVEEPSHGK